MIRTPWPTEHLSPTQLKALSDLVSGQSVEVRSTSINNLIEILNHLTEDDREVTVCCNPHTFKILKDYKGRHSQLEGSTDANTLSNIYSKAIRQLQENYKACYPVDEASIRHQYHALLRSYHLDMDSGFDLDARLTNKNLTAYLESANLSELLSTYKQTWERYLVIDPFHSLYYEKQIEMSLENDLDQWALRVSDLLNDMRLGLDEIIEEEKNRILTIKNQLRQHLVNYQHSQSEFELGQMRQKIGFLIADLPKDAAIEFTDLVMYAVSNWEIVTINYLARHSRRFNSRNHQSVLIYEAMHELRSVLRDIEENGLIKVDISNNPLSYETQIVQVDSLLSQLRFCKYWLEDEKEYIAWRKFYSSLSLEELSVVNTFTSLDKPDIQRQLDLLSIKKWKDRVRANGIPLPENSLAVFEAYKDINAVIDWTSINLMSVISANGDYLLTFDGDNYIFNNLNSDNDILSYTIEDKLLDNIRPMVTLDYYSQSKQANYLSNAIMASKAKVRTFQTKTLNIISCLDDIDTEELLGLMANSKINELKGESISDLIKGSILGEGKEKILVVYDEVLNVYQLENYIWQRLVLQCMSSAGYKIISINTENSLNHVDLSKYFSTYLNTSSDISKNHAV